MVDGLTPGDTTGSVDLEVTCLDVSTSIACTDVVSDTTAGELNKIQKRAHFRYYSRPKNFIRMIKSIRPRQIPYILRRVTNLGAFRTEEVPGKGMELQPG